VRQLMWTVPASIVRHARRLADTHLDRDGGHIPGFVRQHMSGGCAAVVTAALSFLNGRRDRDLPVSSAS